MVRYEHDDDWYPEPDGTQRRFQNPDASSRGPATQSTAGARPQSQRTAPHPGFQSSAQPAFAPSSINPQVPAVAGTQPQMMPPLAGLNNSAPPGFPPTSMPLQVPVGSGSQPQMMASLAGINGTAPPGFPPPSMPIQVPVNAGTQAQMMASLAGINNCASPAYTAPPMAGPQNLQQLLSTLDPQTASWIAGAHGQQRGMHPHVYAEQAAPQQLQKQTGKAKPSHRSKERAGRLESLDPEAEEQEGDHNVEPSPPPVSRRGRRPLPRDAQGRKIRDPSQPPSQRGGHRQPPQGSARVRQDLQGGSGEQEYQDQTDLKLLHLWKESAKPNGQMGVERNNVNWQWIGERMGEMLGDDIDDPDHLLKQKFKSGEQWHNHWNAINKSYKLIWWYNTKGTGEHQVLLLPFLWSCGHQYKNKMS
ncbi:hypothetical protein DUNSADRAFT_6411 [Dunaliella salina]|uniref:Uncharacterized protein n=1 Tax=Dunaliella salina TaxID=3046 RepID=A0ABQ7H6U8_DUNSA|nr:hypothetical protein DUNSADRAFT_6411 [Dunaliella salina]|eukprot:KAF5842561.1 hypothetical protein DUNSADRAFT_6411 [Dunaliella salina]